MWMERNECERRTCMNIRESAEARMAGECRDSYAEARVKAIWSGPFVGGLQNREQVKHEFGVSIVISFHVLVCLQLSS